MKDISSIIKFRKQSTWALLGLGIITYGVYFAHYIKDQTTRINDLVEEGQEISSGFVSSIIIMSYLSLFLFLAFMLVDEGHPVETVSNVFDRIWGVMLLVWGFMARNRVNSYFEIEEDNPNWFHGLWTFLFSPMYFNYKVNCICEESVEQSNAADA